MTEPRFAGGYRGSRASHVAKHDARQQCESGERDCNEGKHASDYLGARLLRCPCETSDCCSQIVGQMENVIAGGDCEFIVDLAQIAQLQS